MIGYGGGVNAGQKSLGLSVVGQVRSARSPPAFVIAKSVAYVMRRASVVRSPMSDSQRRPSPRPHESARGIVTVDCPMTALRSGASSALRASIFAWMAASGVTPMFHGLWKSAVV